MAVVVQRDGRNRADRLDERRHELRLHEPRHVLDTDDVRARRLDARRELLVVVERVDGRLAEVARVADADLGDLVRLAHGVDAVLHAVELVEAVEDPEDVHAVLGREVAELLDDVVRVGCVADRVGAADQHLEADVGDGLAQLAQALPRVLVQEAECDIEGTWSTFGSNKHL